MAAERDTWDRWKLGWQHAFFGLPLTIHLARADLLSDGVTAGGRVLRLSLLLALVGWYVYWFGPWSARARGSSTAPYLIAAAGLWFLLVVLDPGSWIIGIAVLVPLWMRRPAWAAFGVAWCGALWLASRATGSALAWPEVVASMLTVGAGVACLGYVAALDREARKRARLLDELAAAQADLAAAERHAGTLAERQRLAREVHDTLTQGLASIVMRLEAAQERLNGSTAVDRHVITALRTARDNLAESRQLVWALQPAPLKEASLPDAVQQQTRRLAEETGIAASAVVTGEPEPLDEPTEAGVLRVVQEALTNARRHGHPSAISVTLSYLPDAVHVDIHDDGGGIPADPPSVGMGLRAMRERAGELGGTFTIESDPGDGTTVTLTVPIRAAVHTGARA